MLKDVQLLIDGVWRNGSGTPIPVIDPATGQTIFHVASAGKAELDEALDAAARGFREWRDIAAFDRSKVLRKAAQILRDRADDIAPILVAEQGKPLPEAKSEALFSADVIDWFAEEGRRTYGRIIPARTGNVDLMAYREPIGPVAAFTPWNFPISQAVRKLAGAFAAGCSIILKGPEDTPASCAATAQVFLDAGIPKAALSLVFGVPSEISEYLIPNPVIRKISFTGSTPVGKRLAALAGENMKRITLELGGHAPTIIFEDADLDEAVRLVSGAKYRNAGQVCIAPTRIMVHETLYDRFVTDFVSAAETVKVGGGMEAGVQMGPLVSARRLDAMDALLADAVKHGANIRTGGSRIGNAGYFFEPTVLTDVPVEARAMNEEPFGPIAMIAPFRDFNEAVAEANRLDYGLAAYAYTKSSRTVQAVSRAVESGMVAVNSQQLGLPEVPFGGIKDSGYGSEGGTEAMESYLNTKFVSVGR